MDGARKFYYCKICKNLVELINEGGGELVCCGEPMELLVAQSTDASTEKHVPVGTRTGNKLKVVVGSTLHPMLEAHYIQWICVTQKERTQRVDLKPGQAPEAEFDLEDGPVTIFEYCNLHSLWMSQHD